MEISIQYTAFCFKNMPYRDPFNQLKTQKGKIGATKHRYFNLKIYFCIK